MAVKDLMRVDVVLARPSHIGRIARRMRDIDRIECEAMGHSPKMALREGLFNSTKVWTALVDGKPEAMFGLVVNSALTGTGVPWFLGTDEVYKHGKALLLWGPAFVSIIRDSSPRAANLVSADNFKAIRLFGKWGFVVHDDLQYHKGIAFRRFELAGVQ